MMVLANSLLKNDMRRPEFPFDDFFRPFPMPPMERGMRVDVIEEDDRFILEAELPGVNKEDIVVEVKDDVLTVSVSKDEKCEEKREGYVCRERRRGCMKRRFPLEGIDTDSISASYENGVLTVALPKKAEDAAETRRIEVA